MGDYPQEANETQQFHLFEARSSQAKLANEGIMLREGEDE